MVASEGTRRRASFLMTDPQAGIRPRCLSARLLLLVFLLGCQPAVPDSPREREQGDDHSSPGTHTVATLEYSNLTDSRRGGRRVPVKVHHPRDGGPFPLVILSHGATGAWDSLEGLARHLASHGYVVMCPSHVYSNTERTREYMKESRKLFRLAKYLEAGRRMLKDPKAVLERPRDISFVIDQAERWNKDKTHPLGGRIDPSRIAVGGHSFGAYTTYAVCGARPILDHLSPPVKPGKGLGPDLSDPRVSAGIAMSPQGPGGSFFDRESFKTIRCPLLCFSGSRDKMEGLNGESLDPKTRLESFHLMPGGQKYYLWLENAGHMAFADARDKALFGPSREWKDTQRITKAMILVFCDAMLKDVKKARGLLNRKFAESLTGTRVNRITWYQK